MGRVIACFLFIIVGMWAYKANAETVIHGSSPTGPQPFSANTSGQASLTLLAGEDQTNGVMKTEQQFSYKVCTADCQVKDAAGFVHTITCATPAGVAVAAGAVSLRAALTETTPVVATIGLPNAAFTPFTLTIDAAFTTGIYLGYDATVGAVSCTVSYR